MNPTEGVDLMTTKPAIRITAGDVPAPTATLNIVLTGGHLDGLAVSEVEVPGVWPVITTLEQIRVKGATEHQFIPRRYMICLCAGRVELSKRRHVRYCLDH